MDYSITWAYIVSMMKEHFGIDPENTDKHSMYDFKRMMDFIWTEHVNKIDSATSH